MLPCFIAAPMTFDTQFGNCGCVQCMHSYCCLTGMETGLRVAPGIMKGPQPGTQAWWAVFQYAVGGQGRDILCAWPSAANGNLFMVLSRTLGHPDELPLWMVWKTALSWMRIPVMSREPASFWITFFQVNFLFFRNPPCSSVFTLKPFWMFPMISAARPRGNTNPTFSVLFTFFIDKGHPSFMCIFRTVLGCIACGSFQSLRTFHHQSKWYQVTVLIFLLWTELEVQTTLEESSIQLYSYFNSYYSFCEMDWFFSWNFMMKSFHVRNISARWVESDVILGKEKIVKIFTDMTPASLCGLYIAFLMKAIKGGLYNTWKKVVFVFSCFRWYI